MYSRTLVTMKGRKATKEEQGTKVTITTLSHITRTVIKVMDSQVSTRRTCHITLLKDLHIQSLQHITRKSNQATTYLGGILPPLLRSNSHLTKRTATLITKALTTEALRSLTLPTTIDVVSIFFWFNSFIDYDLR